MRPETAWRINAWIASNAGRLLWLILTGAVALQCFEVTEPLAAGFFWITILSLFIAGIVTSGFRNSSPGYLYLGFAIQGAGVLLQVYLVLLHWDTLCAIDEVLKACRAGLVAHIPCADHRLPGWIIWAVCTYFMGKVVRDDGAIFASVGKRPW